MNSKNISLEEMIWYFEMIRALFLQAVLLHTRNKLPSVPLAHAANMEESYENTNYFWKRSSMKNMIGTTMGI
jgi:hypothetical protein